ncbi:MAG: DUF4906 domain-containing protein [Tannerellaceae bacterium]|nr:DUF4906 domain-containing protein [Tannerellaceae bacterium]
MGFLSCEKDQEEIVQPDRYKQIKVNLTLPASTISCSETKTTQESVCFSLGDIHTRSEETEKIEAIENPTIEGLYVLQFNDNNTLIRKTNFQYKNPDDDSFTFTLYESDNTTLFFIANLPEDFDMAELEEYSATIDDLKNISFPREEASLYQSPLTGKYEGRLKENMPLNIELERTVSKLLLTLSYEENLSNGDLKINSIQLKCVPIISTYYNSKEFRNPDRNPYPEEKDELFTDYGLQNVSASGDTFIWYMPENLQGSKYNITDQTMKNKMYAHSHSTYIEITGEYTENGNPSQKVTIRVYPGENNTTDFNIYRNTSYPMKVNITNLDPSDGRITFNAII